MLINRKKNKLGWNFSHLKTLSAFFYEVDHSFQILEEYYFLCNSYEMPIDVTF